MHRAIRGPCKESPGHRCRSRSARISLQPGSWGQTETPRRHTAGVFLHVWQACRQARGMAFWFPDDYQPATLRECARTSVLPVRVWRVLVRTSVLPALVILDIRGERRLAGLVERFGVRGIWVLSLFGGYTISVFLYRKYTLQKRYQRLQ